MSDDDDDKIDQLERLASLRERGLLSAEEFATEKARLLDPHGKDAVAFPNAPIVSEISSAAFSASPSKPPKRKRTGLRITAVAVAGTTAIGAFLAWRQTQAVATPAAKVELTTPPSSQRSATTATTAPPPQLTNSVDAIAASPTPSSEAAAQPAAELPGQPDRFAAEVAWLHGECAHLVNLGVVARTADSVARYRNILAAGRDVSRQNPGVLTDADHECIDRAASESADDQQQSADTSNNISQ
jgi:hypothetical protein